MWPGHLYAILERDNEGQGLCGTKQRRAGSRVSLPTSCVEYIAHPAGGLCEGRVDGQRRMQVTFYRGNGSTLAIAEEELAFLQSGGTLNPAKEIRDFWYGEAKQRPHGAPFGDHRGRRGRFCRQDLGWRRPRLTD